MTTKMWLKNNAGEYFGPFQYSASDKSVALSRGWRTSEELQEIGLEFAPEKMPMRIHAEIEWQLKDQTVFPYCAQPLPWSALVGKTGTLTFVEKL